MKIKSALKPLLLVFLLSGISLMLVSPAFPFLAQYTKPVSAGGAPQRDHWDFTAFAVTWSLNPSAGSNVQGDRTVADVMQASFNTWLLAPNAVVVVSRAADSSATAAGFDQRSSSNINLVCFVCSGDFSKDSSTLAVTMTTVSDAVGEATGHGGSSRFVGQILDADILFNPAVTFSTGGSSPGQDLQTVATHEIGHFFGLDHSGIVRAVMFPFAPPSQQALAYDDVAGLASLYPKPVPDVHTGSLTGTVRFSSGGAVFGAHVLAESTTGAQAFAGSIRKTPIGTLSFPDGTYRLDGLPPDAYIVIAEPLDQPITNSDVSGYGPAFSQASVATGFTTRWH